MRRLTAISVTALLALTLSACASGGAGGEEETGPIKIGVISSLTGNFTPLGTDNRAAVELAAEQVNRDGGIDGRKIELVMRDNKSQPEQAVIAYNDLKGEGIVALVGPSDSNSNLALAPLASRDKIPFMAGAPIDEQVRPGRPFVYMTPPTAVAVAENLSAYLADQGLTRIAVTYDGTTAYGQTTWAGMQEHAPEAGLEIVRSDAFEIGTTDFSPILTNVRGSGAQALVLLGTGAPAVVAAKQFAGADLGIPLVLSPSQASSLWLQPVGQAAEGMVVSSLAGVVGPDLPDSAFKDTVTAMAEAFQQAAGKYPPQFAFDGYTGLILLTSAMEKAGSTDPEAVEEALEGERWLTPSGYYEFSPEDHSGITAEQLSVNVVKGGAFVPTDWALQRLEATFSQ